MSTTGIAADGRGSAISRTLLLNVVAPIATYAVLTGHGLPTLTILVIASIFPTLAIVLAAVRSRRVDALGALTLAAIAVAVVGGLVFDSSRILLDKESVVTGLLGLASLGSLLTSRPLILVLASQFSPRIRGNVSDLLQRSAGFRERSRRLTLIWGVALLADATMRIVLSFLVTPGQLLVLSPLLAAAALGPLALWTIQDLRRRAQVPVPVVA